MLVGRSAECAELDRLLDEARDGRSRTLVLRGEPGVGKTALLEYAAEHAHGMRLLRVTGVESESELAFAALHQVVARNLDRLERLPAPQAEALQGAFGLAAAPVGDPFLISLGLLTLLADLAEDGPVVCLVDDAQWLDEPSAGALVFAARRIEAEGIAMLFAAREGGERRFAAPGLAERKVGALDPDASRTLLEARLGESLAASVRERLVEQSAGNALALLELPASLSEGQLSGQEPLADPLPIGAGLEEAFLSRVRRLPEATQSLLLIAAAEDSGELAATRRAAETLGLDLSALQAAEKEGLVRVTDGRLRFRHPLVRSAIYQGTTFAERQAVHLALAGAQDETNADRRAWHRAAAAEGQSEEIARELEDSAERAAGRGGYVSAAAALERAAALSEQDEERTRRLLAAAEAAWFAGSAERARALLSDAARIATPAQRVSVTQLRGRIEVRRGVFEDALRMLLSAAETLAPTDPANALRLLADAEEATLYIGQPDAVVRIGLLAEEVAATDPVATDRFLALALAGFGRVFAGDAEFAAPLLQEALAFAAASDDLDHMLLAQRVAALLGDDDGLAAFPARAVRLARERGAVGFLPRALERLAYAELQLGRYSSARMHASEGLRLARETGQEPGTTLSLLARVAGLQGREEECRSCAEEALERAQERRSGLLQVLAIWGLGLLELGLGRPEEAVATLESVLPGKTDLTHPPQVLFLIPDYIEAAVRAGRVETAQVYLALFEDWARVFSQPWALALLCHCRGLLSAGEPAERQFEEALALYPLAARPFEHARTELAFGETLRRNRKRREAREHLRAAMATFERLGAVPWEERARNELRASGETARKRDPSTLGDLTPQELQIARLVAAGARNREVAAQLFLSPRTVDYHLRKVFMKLGITSRAELARAGLGADDEVGAAVPATAG